MRLVRRLPHNALGTDYVVGDIHGEFERVEELLAAVEFDRSKDRLFAVGDLIDRGPDSDQCLDWLSRPWFASVMGNHELMALEYWASDRTAIDSLNNGGLWLQDLTPDELEEYGRAFAAMPVVIQIGDGDDAIGVVHGDVPKGMSWPDLLAALEAGGDNALRLATSCVWSRIRMMAARTWGLVTEVPGISRVYVGHTPVEAPLHLGNVLNVDTGACFGGPMHLIRMRDATIAATSPAPKRELSEEPLSWD